MSATQPLFDTKVCIYDSRAGEYAVIADTAGRCPVKANQK
jgi:hypothetical protein